MTASGRRLDLLLPVADLDAATWLWTAIAGVVQPLDLTVPAAALPELLRAAEQAGFTHAAADDPRDRVVTIRPGVSVVLRAQAEPEVVDASASPAPPGRLVRRAPRAEAPRAKRPARKNPDAGRAVPESSARAPRRIVRPRGQVRKVDKK